MSEPASVSAILTVFNRSKYLSESVPSMWNQTRRPDEIILVDDGSTDDTAVVLRSYVRDHTVFVAAPHRGQAAAMNLAAAAAKGTFLAFLDDDDVWTPDKLEVQLAEFASDPGLDVAFGKVEQFIEADAPESVKAAYRGTEMIADGFLHTAMLVKRSAFERVGGFDTQLSVGVIVDWYARAREAGIRQRVVPQIVLRRRIHSSNFGIRNKRSNEGYARMVKQMLDRRRRAANS